MKKAVVNNCCQGKCVLTDQLKQVELSMPIGNASDKTEIKQVQKLSDYTFEVIPFSYARFIRFVEQTDLSQYLSSWFPQSYDLEIFHPPKFQA